MVKCWECEMNRTRLSGLTEADLKMLRAPNLTVQLTRPARLVRMREKEASLGIGYTSD